MSKLKETTTIVIKVYYYLGGDLTLELGVGQSRIMSH